MTAVPSFEAVIVIISLPSTEYTETFVEGFIPLNTTTPDFIAISGLSAFKS